MKKLLFILACALLSNFGWSNDLAPALDKVVFQLSATDWVSTESAQVTVTINATLSNANLVQARNEIKANLKKIASGETWHITRFERSEDSSGLEKLYAQARARLPGASLTAIYDNAKKLSKPGITYTVSALEFSPDLQDIQQVKQTLRTRLYQQVNDEMARLNRVYPQQHYTVNRLYITEGDNPLPAKIEAKRADILMMARAPVSSAALAIEDRLVLTAYVEAASNRTEGLPGAH